MTIGLFLILILALIEMRLGFSSRGYSHGFHYITDDQLPNYIHTLGHAAEYSIFSIEPGYSVERDVELAGGAVGILPASHRDHSGCIMLELGRDFKLDSLLGTAGTITIRITALHDKSRHDAVEFQAVIKLARNELNEILGGIRGIFLIEPDLNSAFVGLDHNSPSNPRTGVLAILILFRIRRYHGRCDEQYCDNENRD